MNILFVYGAGASLCPSVQKHGKKLQRKLSYILQDSTAEVSGGIALGELQGTPLKEGDAVLCHHSIVAEVTERLPSPGVKVVVITKTITLSLEVL